MPECVVTARGPGPDDGPRRFIRSWLSFDETRPVRALRMWMLAMAVATLLAASALLAWFGNHSN